METKKIIIRLYKCGKYIFKFKKNELVDENTEQNKFPKNLGKQIFKNILTQSKIFWLKNVFLIIKAVEASGRTEINFKSDTSVNIEL